MSDVDFKTVAASRGLDETTIGILVDKSYGNEEGLSEMTPAQLNELELTDKQRKALQTWLVDLYVQFNREESSASLQKDGAPALSLTIDKGTDKVDTAELDYEVPSTPKPTAYERCINIGVTGGVSSGKSSLINALRGLEPSDAEAASTKIADKNTGMVAYKLHAVDKMLLWDLPAVEEISEEYVSKVQLGQYDAVVVCTSERLTECDLWVTTVAQNSGVRTFVVRTKVDRDIESDKEDHGEEHDAEKLLGRIRADIEGQMEKVDLYMVSTKAQFREQWDMPKLAENIAGVVKRDNKPMLLSQDTIENGPAEPEVTAGSDGISKISEEDGAHEEEGEKDKIESLAKKYHSEISKIVNAAAKQGSLKPLKKEIEKYKKGFGVEKADLPDVNLDSLETTIDQYGSVKKTGLKTTFMSCFGARSQAALSSETKNKISGHITDEAPTLMGNAVDRCKMAALGKLD